MLASPAATAAAATTSSSASSYSAAASQPPLAAPGRIRPATAAPAAAGYVFPDATVSWGIIGVGDVCEKKAGPALYKARGSTLAAVMRRTGRLAADFAARHGVPKSYDSVAALLADPAVNAVYIASPVGAHLEHALAAARAGKPTLLEKPMARCAAEARRIRDAFRTAGVPLWVAYYRRGHAAPLALKRMIDSGELGTLRWVDYDLSFEVDPAVRRFVVAAAGRAGGGSNGTGAAAAAAAVPVPPLPWRLTPEASGGGLALDVGSHAVDLLDFLVGPLRVNTAASRATRSAAYHGVPVEDFVLMDFVCGGGGGGGGVPGQCRLDFAQPEGRGKHELLRIVGSARTATLRVVASDGITLETAATPAAVAATAAACTKEDAGSSGSRGGHSSHEQSSPPPELSPSLQWLPLPPPEHVHHNIVQAIVNELLATRGAQQQHLASSASGGGGDGGLLDLPYCTSTGDTGIRATEHLDAVLESFYGPRGEGFWERPPAPAAAAD